MSSCTINIHVYTDPYVNENVIKRQQRRHINNVDSNNICMYVCIVYNICFGAYNSQQHSNKKRATSSPSSYACPIKYLPMIPQTPFFNISCLLRMCVFLSPNKIKNIRHVVLLVLHTYKYVSCHMLILYCPYLLSQHYVGVKAKIKHCSSKDYVSYCDQMESVNSNKTHSLNCHPNLSKNYFKIEKYTRIYLKCSTLCSTD